MEISALSYFGDLKNAEDARANQTKLGIKLTRFKNRELAGIKLLMEDNVNASRNQYRFVKVEGSDAPEPDKNASEKCQPVNLCQPLASQRGKHFGLDNKKESIKKAEKKEGIYREVSANVDNVDRLTSLEGVASGSCGSDIRERSVSVTQPAATMCWGRSMVHVFSFAVRTRRTARQPPQASRCRTRHPRHARQRPDRRASLLSL